MQEIVYYHHPDRLWIRPITDSVDNKATEQVTLPFGTFLPGDPPSPINPVFTSYNRIFSTDLDYALNRNYAPGERFTRVDPAEMAAVSLWNPTTLNPYVYVNNDPVNNTDPSGLADVESPSGNCVRNGEAVPQSAIA